MVRFEEFICLLKIEDEIQLQNKHILDISSPFQMAYILSENNTVIKTDININEKSCIKENENLSFRTENATSIAFKDNTFDFVYSISVIEHIYDNYLVAINEMIRVVKPGCYVYITFPISNTHIEEWIDRDSYSNQHKKKSMFFFQYRFSCYDVNHIKKNIIGAEVVKEYIFWEKKSGSYNNAINMLNKYNRKIFFNLIINTAINNFYSFFLMESFERKEYLKPFGNIQILLKKYPL